ncbi:TetR/AcrR family transcriptional regulator [Bacillus sp. BGMRC 2118]|nr:TetR/AcrR family transcriptional regulator [Bacillus sp. BGMRC 2118]
MPRKAVQQELTREMIMDAARDLFATNGYRNVSMRQIAKVLNYSHGAIYYHFKNKAELFYALVEEHFYMLDQKLVQIIAEDIPQDEKLESILLGFIEFGLTYQSHYEIMFLIKDDEVRNFINQGPNKTYERFASTIYQLNTKPLSIQEIWSIFLALHGFVVHYSGHVTSYKEVEAVARAHIKYLIK